MPLGNREVRLTLEGATVYETQARSELRSGGKGICTSAPRDGITYGRRSGSCDTQHIRIEHMATRRRQKKAARKMIRRNEINTARKSQMKTEVRASRRSYRVGR